MGEIFNLKKTSLQFYTLDHARLSATFIWTIIQYPITLCPYLEDKKWVSRRTLWFKPFEPYGHIYRLVADFCNYQRTNFWRISWYWRVDPGKWIYSLFLTQRNCNLSDMLVICWLFLFYFKLRGKTWSTVFYTVYQDLTELHVGRLFPSL